MSNIAIKRPITTIMVVLGVILLGVISAGRLSMDLLPKLNLPIAIVSAQYEGAGPAEIENLVTRPLEGVLSTVSNIKSVDSVSSNGSSLIILNFNNGTDMDVASLEMREKVDMIKGLLPEGVGNPLVMKIDPNNMQATMEIGIGGKQDMVELKRIVSNQIVNRIERIDGVASVNISGGMETEIQVILDQEKMRGYGLSEIQLSQLLMMENLNLPGGNIQEGQITLSVRTIGEFRSIEEIKNLPITTPRGSIIHLMDIADVRMGFKDLTNYSIINGNTGISLSITKQSTANTVQVSSRVNQEIKELQKNFEEMDIQIIYDSAKYINNAVGTVANTAIIGAFLAVLILYVFLRNFRSTFIIATSIPVSVVATFILMYFGGITLNIISLGGLALGIGMLVDNSIVVLENIYRHRHNGEDRVKAAQLGVQEVGMAVVASTLTTIGVFLPIVFVQGWAGEIFREMALTVTFSLLSSLLVAITFVPMLASKILKVDEIHETHTGLGNRVLNWWGRVLDGINAVYGHILRKAIRHKIVTILIAMMVFLLSIGSIFIVGQEFFPAFDEGMVEISVNLPRNTALAETEKIVVQIEEKIHSIPEVSNVFITVGSSGGPLSRGSQGDRAQLMLDVGSVTDRDRSSVEIADVIRELLSEIPGATIRVESSGRSSMGSMSGGSGISIELSGDDLGELNRISEELAALVKTVEGTREVSTSVEKTVKEAVVQINREKAALYGFNVSTVANLIRTSINGSVATKYKLEGYELDVRIMNKASHIEFSKDIENLFISGPTGTVIPLSEIASVTIQDGPIAIDRSNQKRVITISASLSGRDMDSVTQDIRKKFETYILPQGYNYEFTGQQKEMEEAFGDLLLALVLAVLLVYMILASQFESLLHPFTIMLSVPLAFTGALLSLLVTGRTLSIPAYIGIIMLAGIVVNNAIVLIDYINQLRASGMNREEAIIQAGPTRLRPILMTTFTTVLAMIPMALGLGEGAETQAPLATAVIGGLTLSTLLTLIVIPVIYIGFDNISMKITGRRALIK